MKHRYRHITAAIAEVRAAAERLEAACPANQADSQIERVAHTLIHALNDAAREAEGGL